jgi:hypothetical protein
MMPPDRRICYPDEVEFRCMYSSIGDVLELRRTLWQWYLQTGLYQLAIWYGERIEGMAWNAMEWVLQHSGVDE